MTAFDQKSCRTNLSGFAIFITLQIALFMANPAHAATIAVTDMLDANSGAGSCTLRDAITAVNSAGVTPAGCVNSGGAFGATDAITVPIGTYTITGATADDANLSGDLDISKPVIITGAGQTSTIIDGGGIDRVFHASATAAAVAFNGVTIRNGFTLNGHGCGIYTFGATTATLTNSTVSGNNGGGIGGGIYSGGDLTLTGSTVSNNNAVLIGGGIYTEAKLTMTNSTVSNNTANTSTGGIYSTGLLTITNSTISNNQSPTGVVGGVSSVSGLAMTDSTVSGNTASSAFGGINNAGVLTMNNSTVSGNRASSYAGIYSGGPITMTNSTVSNNSATSTSGAITADGSVTLTNSTIYGNSAGTLSGGVNISGAGPLVYSLTTSNSIIANNTGIDCSVLGVTVISNGYNIDSDGSCGLLGIGDQPNTAVATLNLAALANNGGPTMTHALLVGSPAIDAGTCVNATDQRGTTRPQGVTCDIGAYEMDASPVTVTVSGVGSVTGGNAIDCPAILCSESYAAGTVVTLTAVASSGETFTGWGGACSASGTATTCTFTKTSVAQTVSASFGGLGCTDPAANNYNPNATIDDGSCTYGSGGGGSSGGGTVGNQPPTAGRHGDKWLHYPDNGDAVGPDTKFVWHELSDPEGDAVLYDLYICENGDFVNCTPIPVTPSYRTVATVGFGMTGALVIGFCFVGGVRTFRGRLFLTVALLVAGLTLSHCGNSSSSDGSSNDSGRFSCDGEDAFAVCYDAKGLAAGDYKWRVTASDSKGATATSETRSFTVK